MKSKNILIFAAHPDDEVLGCGGAIQNHVSKGENVYVCIITDGSSTQYAGNSKIEKSKNKECLKANNYLGVKEVLRLDFPDMKLDTISHVAINQALEKVIDQIKPRVIYTHSDKDLNRDHQIIYNSTIVITRMGNEQLDEILLYEVLSSSEWRVNDPFIPNTFLDIGRFFRKKIKAFNCYRTEIRGYPHPRNERGIEILARYRGIQIGVEFAESFYLIKQRLR